LLLGNPGLTFLGAAACAMLILLLAGVIAFWPSRRGWRHGLWPRVTSRSALLSAHRNLGVVIALPFALTLITGITLAFPDQINEWLMGEIRFSEEYSNAMLEGVDTIEGPESAEWQPAIERALAVFPGAVVRSAQVPGRFSAYRIIGLQQPGEWNETGLSRVYIDATGGWMDLRMDSQSVPLRERAYNAATPLHTGRIGSLLYKLFLTLVG